MLYTLMIVTVLIGSNENRMTTTVHDTQLTKEMCDAAAVEAKKMEGDLPNPIMNSPTRLVVRTACMPIQASY
ncbi:hypothetical protein [Geopseudomonas aromaticivorans]